MRRCSARFEARANSWIVRRSAGVPRPAETVAAGVFERVERVRGWAAKLLRLSDLAEKYALLDEVSRTPAGRTPERRDAMRRVAERFPAALREWEALSGEQLLHRFGEVDTVLSAFLSDLDAGAGERALQGDDRLWLRLSLDVHHHLVELLRIRRWLKQRAGGASEVSPQLADEFARHYAAERPASAAREGFSAQRLTTILRPPSGRLAPLAFAEVAARQGVGADTLRAAVFLEGLEGIDEEDEAVHGPGEGPPEGGAS
jgi:hypothetical protein